MVLFSKKGYQEKVLNPIDYPTNREEVFIKSTRMWDCSYVGL